jgi:tetratricopeptide (TPR) repeat protein
VLHSLKRFDEAVQSYGRAIRIAADFAEAHYNEGNTLRELRRQDDAIRSYDRAIALRPDFAEAYYNRGNALRNQNRLDEALQSYDRAIGVRPDYAAAHNNRGNALRDLHRFDEAVASYDHAIEHKRGYPLAHKNRGVALRKLKRLEEALQSCDRALALEPTSAEAHVERGNILMELARSGEALQSYDTAAALDPHLPEAHYNRGNALRSLGRPGEALQSYNRTLELNPEFADAYHNRGNAFQELGRPDEALRSYDRAVVLKPDFAESHNNRGNILHALGRLDEALESYDRAIAGKAGYALAYNNKGSTLRELGQLDEALRSLDRAIELAPESAEAYYNKGNVLKGLKRLDGAVRCYDLAIGLRPDFAEAHWNKCVCTLLAGNFNDGWRLYERRKSRSGTPDPETSRRPVWTGEESIAGKTLLVRAEQGLGDTIQFCRFAALAEARGANVVLAVQDQLRRLLGTLSPTIAVTGSTTTPPEFDRHVALLSMPLAFQTRLDNVPAKVAYLFSEPGKVRAWKDRIGDGGFRIGISWQGATGGEVDIGRSIPVTHFERLSAIPDVRLISLQKNAGVEQLLDLPAGMTVETLGDDFDAGADAFIDTAAVMENLHLVITSDTAIAHLAGALGRTTWVALNYVPDWRWLLDRSDSPWYPTMKLFRQTDRDDWPGVFSAIAAQLPGLMRKKDATT